MPSADKAGEIVAPVWFTTVEYICPLAATDALAAALAAYFFAENTPPATAVPSVNELPPPNAHSFADPAATVLPTAYSLDEYSLVSTAAPVVVAHSFAAPRLPVEVTFVPPTLQALALKSELVIAPLTLTA